MFGKVFVKNGSLAVKCFTVLIFCFIFIGCSTNQVLMSNKGKVADVNLEIKDFTTMGIIFVTSSAMFDYNDQLISGSTITYEMLMKEAQKLGAEDIANLRIDEVTTINRSSVDVTGKTITYKATALAIKYVPTVRK
jgi:uncharacterized protein YbjQ (UPF0145 family)